MKTICKIGFYCCILYMYGCEKDSTSPAFVDTPVVQSYLLAGTPVSVNISRQTPFSSTAEFSSDNINALNVLVTNNTTTYTLTPTGNGNYVDSSLLVSVSSEYSISFTFNGKPVSASTGVPSKPKNFGASASSITITGSFGPGYTPPSPIRLGWSNPDASYYIVVVKNVEASPTEINTSTTAPDISFVRPPTTSDSTVINAMQFQYYGKTLLILYHVNPDYATLYNNNTASSQNLTGASSDIANGQGIFTGLNADTLMLDVKN